MDILSSNHHNIIFHKDSCFLCGAEEHKASERKKEREPHRREGEKKIAQVNYVKEKRKRTAKLMMMRQTENQGRFACILFYFDRMVGRMESRQSKKRKKDKIMKDGEDER